MAANGTKETQGHLPEQVAVSACPSSPQSSQAGAEEKGVLQITTMAHSRECAPPSHRKTREASQGRGSQEGCLEEAALQP